ncbi:MAG TPA: UDP-glucose/GDP-mannose dehydrogenase family protein [Anaerolineales bacterium]|nr:UDP-glucose/GDP-mannose dehydrogenase family protein [Anaerolineales bacterium]
MKISIFGLGYVGSVSAACMAALGHEVIGVDINPDKVAMINTGVSTAIEKDMDELVLSGAQTGRLKATVCAADALRESELSFVCVGTPSADNGSLELKYVERVCREIGEALSGKTGFHTVVVRSTMLPGNTEEQIIPILEQASGKCAGEGFGIVFNPEFLREGTAVQDFYHPSFTVIGEYESKGAEEAAKLYEGIDAPLLKVPLRVAEMVKYTNNSFHALKVAFANEIGNICKQQGIDSHQVMEIFCMDHKLNLSPYYLKPGFAFGGSCLPKDLRALLYHAHHMDLSVPILEAILTSNDLQVRRGFEMIRQTGYKKVGVLGFSFKAGTDDLRESPMVELIEQLIGKGYQIKVYDKNVSLAKLYGANRDYIERTIPHISTLMCNSIEEVLSESEVIVIGNKAPEFDHLPQLVQEGHIIIDLVRIMKDTDHLGAQYKGISW